MKLLRVEDNLGYFLDAEGTYLPIDKLTKEDLLRLVNLVLKEDGVEFDAYDEQILKHQAHRIIYKSVEQRLRELRNRRKEFIDESQRLFLPEYERYCTP